MYIYVDSVAGLIVHMPVMSAYVVLNEMQLLAVSSIHLVLVIAVSSATSE